MFRPHPEIDSRRPVIGFLLLSVCALLITVWIMIDLLHEQDTLQRLTDQLPTSARASAESLAGEMQLQFRLIGLVVINLFAIGVAILLLWRAHRSTQGSLRDIKALAEDILSSVDQAIITTDLEGQVSSLNRCAREWFNNSQLAAGRPLFEISGQLPLEDFRIEANASGKTPLIRDFSAKLQGTARVLRTFCQPLRDSQNKTIGNVIQVRDVTSQVFLEQRMRRMERYMGLGPLAAGLHHEIRNPLAALSLHIQLLDEQLGTSIDENAMDSLRVIKSEVTRIGGVLESFRDFASIAKLNLSSIDLTQLIEQQTRLIAPSCKLRNIELVTETESTLPAIHADRLRVEQVLLNLMVNAIDAMPEGGTLTVSVRAASASDAVEIRVADSGSGIPESIQPHIFDPYFSTKMQGTGMGLALSDKIVRQHAGNLEFQTSRHGTIFCLTLPISQSLRDLEPETTESAVHE